MHIKNRLSPQDCADMNDIRAEIDMMDENIIKLIARRFAYVQAAAKFKTSPDTVRAKERFEAMLLQRRVWADEQGLSPEVIEKMYRDLVNYFISEEMKHWSQAQGEK
ncbi:MULTISPECIES: isochorismate lyase [Serratia]|nr:MULTISPECIES: isochorismate lyase [Serratia]QBX68898.1 isochorismate lyase [Serratia quinivorans]RYM62584.1 isochorismate-pyruvate lyase [Serratia proteamaculans]